MRELVNRYLEYLTYEKRYSTHTILNYKKDLEEWQSFCKQELIEPLDVEYSEVRAYLNYCYTHQLNRSTVSRKLLSLR